MATAPFGFGHRAMHKRQAPFGDLIQAAMRIVSPIIDPYDTVQDSPMIPKKVSVGGQQPSTGLRDSQILGLPEYSSLREVPICRGNSQICNFIACTAHNFKNDDNFSNLNLMAQIMSDKKLRTAVSTNPETVTSSIASYRPSKGLSRELWKEAPLVLTYRETCKRHWQMMRTWKKKLRLFLNPFVL
ncbi:Protein F46G11.2 [Aphelenchoides avenae]|nr:Protein F46G11.2 [Aphelenchus avenae]